tara:strand:- start:2969 stop:3310 length:342 start_codon:yes stop_codon:yes gene_type:complete
MPEEYLKAKGRGRGYNQKPFSGFGGGPFTKNGNTDGKETKEDRLTKSMKLQKQEDPDTWTPKGKTSNQELINDLEDRIEFLGEDVHGGRKTQKEVNPAIRKLRKRIAYLRQNK